jgi:hypothetical protein
VTVRIFLVLLVNLFDVYQNAFLLSFFLFFTKGREILMRMLEVFVRKFHSIAMHELPVIMEKW